jgi:methylated-DNA-[protein]-cysteine S-methyltransferase
MLALASAEALCALEFSSTNRLTRLDARLDRWFAPYEVQDGSNPVIDTVRVWLDRYFGGAGHEIDGIALDARGGLFERRVWQALLEIPAGDVSTYGAIAKQLGTSGASRAVGLANGANPIAIIVPCHRVIGSNGTLTGYGGGLERKRFLLDHERRWAREGQLTLTLNHQA